MPREQFSPIAELVREHAAARPTQPALVQGDTDAGLRRARRADGPRRMRAAARRRLARPSHRDVLSGSDADCRRRCSSVRCAPASRWRRSRLRSPRRTSRRCSTMRSAQLLFVDAGAAALVPAAARPRCIALDADAPGRPFDAWLAPPGAKPQPVDDRRPTRRSTSSIRPARPARRRASCSRTACAGRTSCAARRTTTARRA